MKIAAIILAAGSSSRMGRSKQMLDIDGEMLLVKTIRSVLLSGLSPVIVVIGSEEKLHREAIKDLPVDIVHNANWESGMGGSLKAGLRYVISKDAAIEALVVSVCDQPLLSADTFLNLISGFSETGKPIIASRYSGQPGVPALFSKAYFREIETLADDQGAKKIILQNREHALEVDFPGGEIDLDTMEDFQAFAKRGR